MGTEPKVMLVEDDPSMQAVLRTLLELEGFQVFQAGDTLTAEALLAVIQAEQPDSILLDVHLRNNVNGVDLMRELRENPGLPKTRVVMTSGMAMEEECMAAGADDFLLKPFMPDELIQKLRGGTP
jgi:CheY-like chemotaxis protein